MISTPTLDRAASLLGTVLIDAVDILSASEPSRTEGIHVVTRLAADQLSVRALVQCNSQPVLQEGVSTSQVSIKLPHGTPIRPGQYVRVRRCDREPELVGAILLVSLVSEQGASIIRKAISERVFTLDQQQEAFIVITSTVVGGYLTWPEVVEAHPTWPDLVEKVSIWA